MVSGEYSNEFPNIHLQMLSQPNETTCGPTCLQSVYQFYHDHQDLQKVISEVHQFEDGGTLAVWLGCHALQRGYDALLYTCNLQLFDPTWFEKENVNLYRKLKSQIRFKKGIKTTRESLAFMDFLKLGGRVKMEDLTRELIRRYLRQGIPILTGLSSTFLYRSAREAGVHYDDLKGKPSGHFVVLCGYDRKSKHIHVADPLGTNPYSPTLKYEVPIDRVICSILLGAYTYDANFLIIRPKNQSRAM